MKRSSHPLHAGNYTDYWTQPAVKALSPFHRHMLHEIVVESYRHGGIAAFITADHLPPGCPKKLWNPGANPPKILADLMDAGLITTYPDRRENPGGFTVYLENPKEN